MEKINIAEILKDCPKGMGLDSTLFSNVAFNCVANGGIWIKSFDSKGHENEIYLDCEGCLPLPSLNSVTDKCVIFPKGKTTWKGFVPPCKLKDGDVLTYMYNNKPTIYIYRENGCCNTSFYAAYSFYNESFYKGNVGGLSGDRIDLRLATEEEKEKLFQAIKDNGYKWNSETKTLEKLDEPKFKDGDILSYQCGGFKNRTVYIYRYHKTLNTSYYVALSGDDDSTFRVNYLEGSALNAYNDTVRFATEEEKQKLFDAIKANGYKWNAETKTLESWLNLSLR